MSRRRQHSTYWRSGHALGRVLPGYGERHVRTAWFGTGEARLASLVSKDRSYKPMVKTSGGKRESDGVVVPLIAVSNAAGGKGPDFGHSGNGSKREGMTRTARSNYPIPEGIVTMSRGPSLSRVRANRTHGLKGGWGTGSAVRAPRS